MKQVRRRVVSRHWANAAPTSHSAARTNAGTATTATALTTLGLAAACWVVAVWLMSGMDMGASTRLGSFAFFVAVWLSMMAAMMLVALGVMSVIWMAVVAVLVLAQKVLPAKGAIDVPVALAIVGLGSWILAAPSSVPGLMPPM